MNNDFISTVNQAVKYWWVSLLIGVISIILGFACIAAPGATLVALTTLFIIGFLVGGILEIVFAISNRNCIKGWGWNLAIGIVGVIFGLLLLAMPISSISVMLFFVGFWIMFQSFWSIGTAMQLNRAGIKGWGWILAFGIFGLILSFILITNPVFAAGFVVYLMAFTLIYYGIVRIYFGVKLKSFQHKMHDDLTFHLAD